MKHTFRCSFVIYFLLILINSSFSLNIKCFPSGAVLVIDNSVIQPVDDNNGIKRYNLDSNWKYAFLRAPGYRDRYIPFHIPDGSIEEYKLEKIDTHLVFEQTIDTGEQPKSVRFSPDGKYLVAALLNSGGSMYSVLMVICCWRNPCYRKYMQRRRVSSKPFCAKV